MLQQQGSIPGLEETGASSADAAGQEGVPTDDADLSGLGLGEEATPRLRARSTLVIEFSPRLDAPDVSAEEQRRIDDFRDRLARGNPYQLDGAGILYLPGVPAIELAGLDVNEATVRIRTEPQLS